MRFNAACEGVAVKPHGPQISSQYRVSLNVQYIQLSLIGAACIELDQ